LRLCKGAIRLEKALGYCAAVVNLGDCVFMRAFLGAGVARSANSEPNPLNHLVVMTHILARVGDRLCGNML